jgi:signal transduction histidine kinase/ActR/RegA family two-component response regulator
MTGSDQSAGSDQSTIDGRVLILAPTGRDSELMCGVLENAGVRCKRCDDMRDLCLSLDEGAAALLIAEEALAEGAYHDLIAALLQQPPWSEPPILILSERGADSAIIAEALQNLDNVTVLERPTRIPALVSAVHSALRSRHRQYQIRSHIAEREHYAEALRAADRRKDEFLATLAHELRNPLAPMRTALEIMRVAPRNESAREQAQSVLERQLRQMARLIDDLLDLSRISHGKLELRREAVTLDAIVDSAVEITRSTLHSLGHMLEVELPSEPVHIDGDATRLAQVFSNLLHNAAKYTEHSGRISLTARRAGDCVLVSVKDTGIGIAPENLERVFEMFTQVGRSLEQSRGGLGVGLALSQWLVQLHGGSITARSEGVGRGSEFIVSLPVAHQPLSETGGARGSRENSATAGRRVLVVDDNRDFADSFAAVLRMAGHEVSVTYDGAQAVAVARMWEPDVVLLDIGLPLMNGYEAARRIREALPNPNLLLVAITGWGQEEDRRRSRAAGFDHHFVKPVDPGMLTRLIADHVARSGPAGGAQSGARFVATESP